MGKLLLKLVVEVGGGGELLLEGEEVGLVLG